jgi:hypothetical protein
VQLAFGKGTWPKVRPDSRVLGRIGSFGNAVLIGWKGGLVLPRILTEFGEKFRHVNARDQLPQSQLKWGSEVERTIPKPVRAMDVPITVVGRAGLNMFVSSAIDQAKIVRDDKPFGEPIVLWKKPWANWCVKDPFLDTQVGGRSAQGDSATRGDLKESF